MTHDAKESAPMELRPDQITIAVTVFSRREFILDAIRSALNQTIPVKVIVVEDCGPDATLRDFILKEFGNRIEYFRNPKNRGLFDNWNACLEYCRTPWLSILHDDDELRPNFIETMLALVRDAPERALYFGRHAILENGKIRPPPPVAWKNNWRDLDIIEAADQNLLPFPGQLFRIAEAQMIGGFRAASYLTGDWDMWFRLALKGGLAQSATEVSFMRWHEGMDRGSTRVERMGWKWALDNVQRKRNLALLLRQKGIVIPFERTKLLKQNPIPSRLLLRNARGFSRRILFYDAWLFTHSRPPHWRYAALQWLVRIFGSQTLCIFHFNKTNKGLHKSTSK
jgi:glycosyltransferase involved in cell wall biosynthesis